MMHFVTPLQLNGKTETEFYPFMGSVVWAQHHALDCGL